MRACRFRDDRKCGVKRNKISLTVVSPFLGVPIKQMLIESVKKPLEKAGLKVEINERVMNGEDLQKFFKK